MEKIKFGYFVPNTESFSKFSNSYTAFKEGDILLAKVTPCFENGNIAVAENLVNGKGFGSSELFVVRQKEVNGKFLFYYFQSHFFKKDAESSMTGAGGLKRVDAEILKRHEIPVPSIQTQKKIADYLDRETARIDALIEAKEKMLALLEEKRQALISRAVTKGFNKKRFNWQKVPLKFVCELNPAVDFSSLGKDDVLTFLPMEKIKCGYFTPNKESYSKFSSSYTAFEEGDILLAKVTPCFENGNIAIAENLVNRKGFGSSELFVVRPKRINRKFLFYYFQSTLFKQEGEASMTGAGGLKRVDPNLLKRHKIPYPSLEEQKQIINHIDSFTKKSLQLSKEIEKSIALLRERRAALIGAAVMGEIELGEKI